ncbi:MAG: AbrB family transcriptional regulator [Proteobacteria bacterium]|nr:AbrB family transcriptional regulator [Pseudomonadota bacterium]MDA0951992.1 AbrB family transcriptional regulator [Pseudomonadota bacterium]
MRLDPATGRKALVDLRTVVLGTAGGLLFMAIGMPAALLAGSMVAVAATALAGVKVGLHPRLRDLAFIVLGAILGATIDRDTVASFASWPISLAGLLLSLVAVMVVVPRYLTRRHGIDRPTAWLCAIPGALSYVIALASDLSHVDLRRVAVLQTLRVAMLLALIPAAVGLATDIPPHASDPGETITWPMAALIVVLCIVSVPLARRLRMPAPTFVAPMFLSGALSIAGFYHGQFPVALLWPSLVITGIAVGARFAGTSAFFLWQCLKAGMGGLLIALAITSGFALGVSAITGDDFLQLCLAFAPGGFDVMPVLAFAFDLDPAFVAGHQLVRFLAISLTLPFLLRRISAPVAKE